jgi:ferredoxin-NADP reductase
MNEWNVCIGDVVSVGDQVLLQVSLPRQPCFKLNHRFKLKNFAPNTYKTSRTGWYYRVLREGTVQVGDEIKVVERPWPTWPIARIQEYLHRSIDNLEMNEEISNIQELGDESRGAFKRRVAKQKAKEKRRGEGQVDTWRNFKLIEKTIQTPRVSSFVLEAITPDLDAESRTLGAHAKLRLPNGMLRSYSIVSGEHNKFELGIALDDNSRGGSKYLHESLNVGDTIEVGKIAEGVPSVGAASNHVFIVGGIGITAFLAMMELFHKIHLNFTLHLGIRSPDELPFRERLEGFGERTIIYDKSKGQRMDIPKILRDLSWNSHVYVCGPNRVIEGAQEAAKQCRISESDIHYEAFTTEIGGDPFEAEISNRGKLVQVKDDESLLEVLRKEFGEEIPSSCEVGNCGTCKISLKSGLVSHRGTALTQEDKITSMLSCVSRGIGRIVVEI